MMKKLICTALMLLAIQLSWAVNAKQLFAEFKDAENADYVSIPSLLMKMGRMFMDDDEDKSDAGADLAKKINSMKVLDLEKCSGNVKRRFMKRVNELNTDGYEELMRVNDENEKVKILIREEGTTIKEVLFVCSGPEDCALIQFTGDFKESDIEILVKQETEKKHD